MSKLALSIPLFDSADFDVDSADLPERADKNWKFVDGVDDDLMLMMMIIFEVVQTFSNRMNFSR